MIAKSTRLIVSVVVLLFATVSVLAADVGKPAAAKKSSAEKFVKTTVRVPMRDGVRLATDVYRPESATGPLPVIFSRGPYGKGGAKDLAKSGCARGYVVVSQDMRGRHESEGNDAVVFHNDGWAEHQDGHDSLAWIVGQPWCNGKIATHGGSALGITQTMMAPGASDALKAQWVVVAFSDMYSQGAYEGGVWRKSLLEFWLKSQKFDDRSLESFIKHPKYDSFWAESNAEALAARVNAPGVYVGGWYDIFLQGTINSFVTIHNHGGPGARGKCRLILGPFGHGFFSTLKYPANSRQPAAADALRFFDHHLKGEANGVANEKAVHYYVMGDPTDAKAPGNFWREADNWPPASTATSFYLCADGRLATERPAGADVARSYRYDPTDPVPTLGGQNLALLVGPADLRPLESRKDVLVFSSDVLKEPVEVTGRISADLFVSSDCPDTDFTAMLADVYPDGRSMLVTDGILRTRYRKSFEREEFLEPNKTYELDVDLWSTSLVFNKGHRIRVLISSSNSPRFEPNPNTGSPFRADRKTRVATNTLHLSGEHASRLVLPIYGQATQQTRRD